MVLVCGGGGERPAGAATAAATAAAVTAAAAATKPPAAPGVCKALGHALPCGRPSPSGGDEAKTAAKAVKQATCGDANAVPSAVTVSTIQAQVQLPLLPLCFCEQRSQPLRLRA